MQLVFIQKITHHSVQNNFIPEDSDGRTGQRHWARLIIVNDQYYHLVYPNIMQKITTMWKCGLNIGHRGRCKRILKEQTLLCNNLCVFICLIILLLFKWETNSFLKTTTSEGGAVSQISFFLLTNFLSSDQYCPVPLIPHPLYNIVNKVLFI